MYRANAEAIVYRALTIDVPGGVGPTIPGFCHCSRSIREMEFLFLFPEEAHPRISDPTPGKLVVERGFIKGFVDLVVEHAGLVYVVDWKSDFLPSYDEDAVTAHVVRNYGLQAKLYAMAAGQSPSDSHGSRIRAAFRRDDLRVSPEPRGTSRPRAKGLCHSRPAWSEVLLDEADLIHFGDRASGGLR